MVLDVKLLRRLMDEIVDDEMYSHGVLNSEGRKVLELIVKCTIKEHPELKRLFWRVRRNPTRENVVKLLNILEELL